MPPVTFKPKKNQRVGSVTVDDVVLLPGEPQDVTDDQLKRLKSSFKQYTFSTADEDKAKVESSTQETGGTTGTGTTGDKDKAKTGGGQ